jgi:hypothetical protein
MSTQFNILMFKDRRAKFENQCLTGKKYKGMQKQVILSSNIQLRTVILCKLVYTSISGMLHGR